MSTRYPVTRLLTLMLGACSLYDFYETVRLFAEGPPDGSSPFCPLYENAGGFSWISSTPILDFALAVTWETLAILGTALLCPRPRAGFFVAGMGYLLYMILSLFDFYLTWSERSLDQSMWMLRFFGIPIWLLYASAHDEPKGAIR